MVWANGMRTRQLLLGLLLHPSEQNGYNRYPGFLAPITLAEILHDIAEAEELVDRTHAHLNLGALLGWGKGDAARLCDLVRSKFSIHGEVGNFFEIAGVNMSRTVASPKEQITFKDPSSDDDMSNISAVLPSSCKPKVSLIESVVMPDSEVE